MLRISSGQAVSLRHLVDMYKRLPFHYIAIAAAAAALSAAPFAAGEGFIIPVDRPLKAGDTHRLEIEVETLSEMKLTAGDEVVENTSDQWKAKMEVTRKVAKVDGKGDAVEMTIEIHRSSWTKGGEPKDVLPDGTVVKGAARAADEDKDVFTVNGERVDDSIGEVLSMMFDLSSGRKGDGDENKAFGVDKARKVGEKWEVDIAEFVATMPDDFPIVVDIAEAKGGVRFVELTGSGENRSAILQGEVELKIKEVKGMPPGANFKGSTTQIALDGLFPINNDGHPIRKGANMILSLRGTIPTPNGAVNMSSDLKITRKVRLLP